MVSRLAFDHLCLPHSSRFGRCKGRAWVSVSLGGVLRMALEVQGVSVTTRNLASKQARFLQSRCASNPPPPPPLLYSDALTVPNAQNFCNEGVETNKIRLLKYRTLCAFDIHVMMGYVHAGQRQMGVHSRRSDGSVRDRTGGGFALYRRGSGGSGEAARARRH